MERPLGHAEDLALTHLAIQELEAELTEALNANRTAWWFTWAASVSQDLRGAREELVRLESS
jgi:hypothetical protein